MSKHQLGDAPIEAKHRDMMQAIAGALDEALNPGLTGKDKKIGFVVLVFPFDGHEGRANYISNGADRKDICTLFREQIARFEGQPEMSGRA